jgi:pimeloyl-ACP methyl ester carboxylesterase
MLAPMRLSVLLLPMVLSVSFACGRKEESKPTPTSAPAAPPASPTAPEKPPPGPPTPSSEVSFETSDGVPLAGTHYDAGAGAPLLVFSHRFRGDRNEWRVILERLAVSEKRYSMVNFDHRGHGASATASGKKQLSWATMSDSDIPSLVTDIHAAIKFGLERAEGDVPGVVLVGSSLGAALVAAAAGEEPKVRALGLISPGARIMGFDVYRRFADVRELPSFIACSTGDNVCKDPHDALGRMGRDASTTKIYDGDGHGAHIMSKTAPRMAEDLEGFLATVYDEQPKERRTRAPRAPVTKGKQKP